MKTTGKVVVGLGAVALAYEAYTLANKEEDDTISEFIWSVMRRPLVPFVIGTLVGHFVWQSQDVYDVLAEKALKDRRKKLRRREDLIAAHLCPGVVPA